MTKEITHIGYSGVGIHADRHIVPQLDDPRAAITALYDPQGIPPRFTELLPQARCFTEKEADQTEGWQSFLGGPDLDAVYIAAPDECHTSRLHDVLAAGKHALVEGPLATTWEDFERLQATMAATPDDLVISTCHPRRFDQPFVNTKYALDHRPMMAGLFGLPPATDFGPVRGLSIRLNYPKPLKTDQQASFAFDRLAHEIDTASYFFGLEGLSHAINVVNDQAAFEVRATREDGVWLNFQGNRNHEGRTGREDWRVYFDEGVQLAVDAAVGSMALTQYQRPIGIGPLYNLELFKTSHDRRFALLNRRFVSAVRGEKAPYITRQEMLMNTAVALAAQEVDRPVSISAEGQVRQL